MGDIYLFFNTATSMKAAKMLFFTDSRSISYTNFSVCRLGAHVVQSKWNKTNINFFFNKKQNCVCTRIAAKSLGNHYLY